MENNFQKHTTETEKEIEGLNRQLKELQQKLEESLKKHSEDLEGKDKEYQGQIENWKKENQELIDEKSKLIDDKFNVEKVLDKKTEKINELERQVSLAIDEVNCRKQVIDSMSNSLLSHEKESAKMAESLSIMKN